jgi:tetratricopeptide (TPR) repeat protein
MLYKRKGKCETAFQRLGRGLDAVGSIATLEEARIYLAGSGVFSIQGKHRQALDWCKAGLAIARQLSSRPVLADATCLLRTIHGHLGHSEEEIACARQSFALYEELGDPVGQIKALNNLGVATMEGGDWEAAIDYYRRGIGLGERIGDVNFHSGFAVRATWGHPHVLHPRMSTSVPTSAQLNSHSASGVGRFMQP